jgi:prolyl-tRNA editing enzyme YbaK/EbsC (Cys-tRNA(Pro) deacylase)
MTTKDLKHSSQRFQDFLQDSKLETQVIELHRLTRTSKETAELIGCEVGQIAKTLIYKGKKSHKPLCVILSGKNHVDEAKVAGYFGEEIEKPDAHFIVEHTKFVVGGIPPLGYPLDNKPLIDKDLVAYPNIWAAAGTPYAVFRISPDDLQKITGARVVDISASH